MSEGLHPSTLGEILDRTAQLCRRNFWMFAGVAALPIGVLMVITALGGASIFLIPGIRGGPESGVLAGVVIVLFAILFVPIYIAAGVYSYAGLTEAAVSVHRGERPTIRALLVSVRPSFWRYLWFIILQGIVVAFVPGMAAFGAAAVLLYMEHITGGNLTTSAAIGFLIFLVIAAAVVVVIWLALGFSLGFAVCVVEQKPAWESLKRSWTLSQGTRWRIFVMYLLVLALVMVVSMIAAVPVLIVLAFISAGGNGAELGTSAVVVAQITRLVMDFVFQALLAPVSWIALVLFYYDQRIRKEGFDIEWMMQKAGLVPQPSVGAAASSSILGLATAPSPLAGNASDSGAAAPPDTVEER